MAQSGSACMDDWADRSYPVAEDMALQRRTWRVERIGWIGLAAVILAAILGLCSIGPLSHVTRRDPGGGFAVTHESFERNGTMTTWELQVAAQPGNPLVVRVADTLLAALAIESIRPQPAIARLRPDGVEFLFQTTPGQPARIFISLRPEGYGPVSGGIAVNGSPPLPVHVFIWP